jgi:hypothetical protein
VRPHLDQTNTGNVDIAYGMVVLLLSIAGDKGLRGAFKNSTNAPKLRKPQLLLEDGGVQEKINAGRLLKAAPEEAVNPPKQTRFYADENGRVYDSQATGKTPWQKVQELPGQGNARYGSQTTNSKVFSFCGVQFLLFLIKLLNLFNTNSFFTLIWAIPQQKIMDLLNPPSAALNKCRNEIDEINEKLKKQEKGIIWRITILVHFKIIFKVSI